ncbi:MAG: hypothetical protein RIS50_257, partial [Bacteroidota bacterium]
ICSVIGYFDNANCYALLYTNILAALISGLDFLTGYAIFQKPTHQRLYRTA